MTWFWPPQYTGTSDRRVCKQNAGLVGLHRCFLCRRPRLVRTKNSDSSLIFHRIRGWWQPVVFWSCCQHVLDFVMQITSCGYRDSAGATPRARGRTVAVKVGNESHEKLMHDFGDPLHLYSEQKLPVTKCTFSNGDISLPKRPGGHPTHATINFPGTRRRRSGRQSERVRKWEGAGKRAQERGRRIHTGEPTGAKRKCTAVAGTCA